MSGAIVFEADQQLAPGSAAEPAQSLHAAIAEARRLLAEDSFHAETFARSILAGDPDNRDALYVLGAALRLSGQTAQAREVLQRLVELWPRSCEVRLELGKTFADVGEHRSAAAVLSQAVNLDRGSAEAWRTLSEQLLQIGDSKGSEAAFVQHFLASVDDPQLRKAVVALFENRPDDAEELVLEFLETHPDDVNAIKLMSEIAVRLGRNEDAEALLARCLELAPKFVAARFRYASALFQLNKVSLAIAQLEILLAEDPRNTSYRNLMAAALEAEGRHQQSMAVYRALAEEFPNVATHWVSYGHALKVAGSQAECIAAYQRAIELQPSFGAAYWSLACLRTFRFSENDVSAIEFQLALHDLRDEDRTTLHFSLGKAYEDLKRYADSFAQYAKGNELRRAGVDHDPEMTSRHLSSCRVMFTREFFREREGAGCKASDPIFIVGVPRSGSTLIEQILSSHSAIEGTMELPEITTLARRVHEDRVMSGAEYPEVLVDLNPAELTALGEEYLENTRIQRKLGRPYFTDKMPNNFAHIGLIQLILPNARIIDARRHPLGCCLANFRVHFGGGQIFTYRLTELARYYRDYVALLAHFDDVLPGKIHRIMYEQMVAEPEKEVRRLLDYLGLPFEESCLRFYETNRPVRTASSEQVRMPIFKEAVEHWRNYEQWLAPAKEILGPVLDRYPDVPAFDK